MLFTVFFILIGVVFVGGAMGVLIGAIIDEEEEALSQYWDTEDDETSGWCLVCVGMSLY